MDGLHGHVSAGPSVVWVTVEAGADEAAVCEVGRQLLAANVVVRVVGPEDWADAELEPPDEPWEVQVPEGMLGRAMDALEQWDDERQ